MMYKRCVQCGIAALGLVMGAGAANAFDPLPNLVNLDFSQHTGGDAKNTFQGYAPTGWTGGSGLIYIASQTPGQTAADYVPGTIQTYGNPVGAVTGNYVEADGNPDYEGSFNYQVTGLTPGKTYTLSFYQGASQQVGFSNGLPTTNQWIVSLADVGLSVNRNTGTDPIYGATSTYYSTDPNASIAASQLMTVDPAGTVGWQFVSVDLTAYTDTELLSFLAWGDKGSTINLPPIAFLAGVNSPPGLGSDVPEPATWAMMVTGFLGVGGAIRMRRKAGVAAAA